MFRRKLRKKCKLDKKLVEGIVAGLPVFIKDTGIEVLVEDFKYEKNEKESSLVGIEIKNKVSAKALSKLTWFEIKTYNRATKETILTAHISREDLSLLPFETAGAAALYAKKV